MSVDTSRDPYGAVAWGVMRAELGAGRRILASEQRLPGWGQPPTPSTNQAPRRGDGLPDGWMTAVEAAARLGVSESTVRKQRQARSWATLRWPSGRPGGNEFILVRWDDVERLRAERAKLPPKLTLEQRRIHSQQNTRRWRERQRATGSAS